MQFYAENLQIWLFGYLDEDLLQKFHRINFPEREHTMLL